MDEPPRVPFRAMTHHVSGVPIVSVRGEICYATASTFEAAVERAVAGLGPRDLRVVVDLAGVEFMDSEGLKVVLASVRRLEGREVEVRFVAREGAATRIVEKAGMRDGVVLYRSVAAAIGDRGGTP